MTRHHIILAGRIAVQVRDTVVDERALPGRQPRLAFAVLVAERHRPVAREELAENLWPGRRPDTWEAALRGVVSRVRGFVASSGLGPRELLHAHAGSYQLHPLLDVEVDVERAMADTVLAEKTLAADDAVTAAELAGGARAVLVRPLLPGIDGPWLEAKRRELSMVLFRSLEVLGEARARLGDHGGAASAAEAAIWADPFRESGHRLLIRAYMAAGDGAAGLRAYEQCRVLLADELGVDPSPETQALHLALLRGSDAPRPTLPLPSSGRAERAVLDEVPYLGMQTFDEQHASRFFGRAADVSRLLDRLGQSRFLAVLGASGSGKSSLVRAGLLPALRGGALAGSDTWLVAVLRPGSAPLGALTRALLELDPRLGRTGAMRRLGHDEAALLEVVEEARRDGLRAERVLVVVDQLEEVFTLCRDAGARRQFLATLAAAGTGPGGGRTVVVVTLRADFYQHLAAHPSFADIASSHQFLVTPMDEVGLAEAVEGPAHAVGLALEPGLTETILRDVARRPGALPLLGHALLELWEHRPAGMLTLEAYHATGGVDGAIAQRAEAIYNGLSADEQVTTRRVLLRLTQPGESTTDTRRRVAFSELVPRPEDRRAVERVVDLLTAARLLTSGGEPNGEARVEVAHEALITGWPRFRAWVEADRAGLLVHRRLTEAATGWERLGRDDGALYRGAALTEAAAWAERDQGTTNALERVFLAASLDARAAAQRGRVRRMRLVASALGVGLLVAGGLTVFAFAQSARLAGEVRVTTARELAAAAIANLEVDSERSLLLALEAVEVTREADGTVVREAEEALHRAVKASRLVRTVPQGGHGVAMTSDGARFVTVGSDPGDNSVTVWDAETGHELLVLVGPDAGRPTVTLSPDDRLIATTHDDGTVRLWDAAVGEELSVLRGHEGYVTHAAFSPDGRWLATGGRDRTVRVWDVAAAVETTTLSGSWDVGLSPAFSPDGSRLAVAHWNEVWIWDVAASEVVGQLSHRRPWVVQQVRFSPDGTHLVTSGTDGTAHLWDAETLESVGTFTSPVPLDAVAYSPDGSWIATGGRDGVARIWDVESGREVLSLAGHTGGGIVSLAFSADGDLLLTGGLDDTTRVWDVGLAGAREWVTVPGATGTFPGVDFSPDGRWFAAPAEPAGVTVWDTETGAEVITLTDRATKLTTVTFSPDGALVAAASDASFRPPVWDVETGELRFKLEGHTEPPHMVAFSPGGTRLVTGSDDGTARIWDAASGEQQHVLRAGSDVHAAAFTPDGQFVLTGEGSGDVTVWDAASLEPRRTLPGHAAAVTDLAFGPDGLVVSASEDGTAKVWDLDAGEERLTFAGHGVLLNQVAVSPDGTVVATTSDDRTTRLWDPASGRELLTLVGHDALVYGVAFDPDGRLLATASPDGTVALHVLPVDELVELARERVTRSLTDEECHRYLQRPTCDLATAP